MNWCGTGDVSGMTDLRQWKIQPFQANWNCYQNTNLNAFDYAYRLCEPGPGSCQGQEGFNASGGGGSMDSKLQKGILGTMPRGQLVTQ